MLSIQLARGTLPFQFEKLNLSWRPLPTFKSPPELNKKVTKKPQRVYEEALVEIDIKYTKALH